MAVRVLSVLAKPGVVELTAVLLVASERPTFRPGCGSRRRS